MPPSLRLAWLAVPLLVGAAGPTRASELVCPNRISIGGVEARFLGGTGIARVDNQNRLLCTFQGVGFFASSARPPGGNCPTGPLPAVASGGSGQWRFGPPGSPASLTPPVQPAPEGCLYGGRS